MTKKLLKAVQEQKKNTQQSELQIMGVVGTIINGQRTVEVSNRNAFIYVRLRDNTNEVVQAFNNQVSPSYNLPVILQWQDNRYIVLGVDTARYQNNWPSFSAYLPRHGTQHSFSDPAGGDLVWVYSRQFMPMLAFPSGTNGAAQVILSPSVYRHPEDGAWDYIGATGTPNLTLPKPTDSQARMLLLYWDLDTDSVGISTGTLFSASITGTSGVLPYIPTVSGNKKLPIAGVRLVSGTSSIGWENLYDLRQFTAASPLGFDGGFAIWDEGVPQGTGTTLNFVGAGITATISGSVARISVTATGGGGDSLWTTGSAGFASIISKDSLSDAKAAYALAHGYDTNAFGIYSHAEGYQTTTSGSRSHAEGNQTLALGLGSHAEGDDTVSLGSYSHAEGGTTLSSGIYSHAEGEETQAFGRASLAAGGYNNVYGDYSASLAGILHEITGDYSSVLSGDSIVASADNTAYTEFMNVRSLGSGASVSNVGIDANGFLVTGTAIRPADLSDASAPNNLIYYSTTQGKLVYKNVSGTVYALY